MDSSFASSKIYKKVKSDIEMAMSVTDQILILMYMHNASIRGSVVVFKEKNDVKSYQVFPVEAFVEEDLEDKFSHIHGLLGDDDVQLVVILIPEVIQGPERDTPDVCMNIQICLRDSTLMSETILPKDIGDLEKLMKLKWTTMPVSYKFVEKVSYAKSQTKVLQ